MNRRWFKWPSLAALCLALVAVSCDRPQATETTVDIAPSFGSVDQSEYSLVREALPLPVPDLSTSSIIGVSGGQISLLGHTLQVPAGAVTVPTIFTMTVLTNGYIEVELTAMVSSLLGTVSVGEKGFKKPVTLTLTYARSPDKLDPSKLLIVYVNGSKLEPLPSSVNTVTKTVSAQLSHFSKYAMATD